MTAIVATGHTSAAVDDGDEVERVKRGLRMHEYSATGRTVQWRRRIASANAENRLSSIFVAVTGRHRSCSAAGWCRRWRRARIAPTIGKQQFATRLHAHSTYLTRVGGASLVDVDSFPLVRAEVLEAVFDVRARWLYALLACAACCVLRFSRAPVEIHAAPV